MKANAVYVDAILAVCIAMSMVVPNAHASSVVVGTCRPLPQYSSITAAISSVPAGSTVNVCPGTYAEQVLITKSLTLVGVQNGSNDAAVLVPPAGGIVQNGVDILGNAVGAQIFVAAPASTVAIRNLTVDGTGNNVAGCGPVTLEGIYFQNTTGTIANNVVRNQYQTDFADFGGCQNGLAINIEGRSVANTVTVSGNSVRAYQKNGITATGGAIGGPAIGPVVTINNNYIVGLAATARNWQGVYNNQGVAAENGIQVGFGATAKVTNNVVNDNIWGQDTSSDTGDAASGILVYSSSGVSITGNIVGSAQFGIVAVGDLAYAPADNTVITGNKVVGTQIFDGIDVCSNNNTVQSNTIEGSTESGVHVDGSCGGASGNTVSKNTINEACAGVLDGGAGSTISTNTFFNVVNTTLGGDVCPVPVVARSVTKHAKPSPFHHVGR